MFSSSSSLIHSNNTWINLSTFSKQFWSMIFICLRTGVSTDLHMQILCQQEALLEREKYRGFPGDV